MSSMKPGDVVCQRVRGVFHLGANSVDDVRDGPLAVDQLPDHAADVVDAVILTGLEVEQNTPLSGGERAKRRVRVLPESHIAVDHACVLIQPEGPAPTLASQSAPERKHTGRQRHERQWHQHQQLLQRFSPIDAAQQGLAHPVDRDCHRIGGGRRLDPAGKKVEREVRRPTRAS